MVVATVVGGRWSVVGTPDGRPVDVSCWLELGLPMNWRAGVLEQHRVVWSSRGEALAGWRCLGEVDSVAESQSKTLSLAHVKPDMMDMTVAQGVTLSCVGTSWDMAFCPYPVVARVLARWTGVGTGEHEGGAHRDMAAAWMTGRGGVINA